jgi:hypothetical protein
MTFFKQTERMLLLLLSSVNCELDYHCFRYVNNVLGAAAWSSGLACLSFALRVRGSNPGVDTVEKGKKEQITFHLFRIV